MSYRVQSPLDFSDTDSESETYWKRLSTCAQKGDTDCQESIERRRCNIWVKTANENILDEALSSAHIVTRSSDTSRHVENYFEYPASQETPSNTSESKQLRRRVGSAKSRIQERHWNESIPRNHIGVTFDSPPDVVKKTLVRLLKEPNEELISQIVDVLGCKRALEFYFLTEDIEKIGGLYCAHPFYFCAGWNTTKISRRRFFESYQDVSRDYGYRKKDHVCTQQTDKRQIKTKTQKATSRIEKKT
ncbi:unnamed protein product [Dicrocoelium dendriticum]|nr:unnamed protein product [Dicrocoelium dendriticum]